MLAFYTRLFTPPPPTLAGSLTTRPISFFEYLPLLMHAFFNLTRVCKTDTPMPLFLSYLMTKAASSFYT